MQFYGQLKGCFSKATESLLMCLPGNIRLPSGEKIVFASVFAILMHLFKQEKGDKNDFLFGLIRIFAADEEKSYQQIFAGNQFPVTLNNILTLKKGTICKHKDLSCLAYSNKVKKIMYISVVFLVYFLRSVQ